MWQHNFGIEGEIFVIKNNIYNKNKIIGYAAMMGRDFIVDKNTNNQPVWHSIVTEIYQKN